MTLRARVTLAAGFAVLLAVVAVSIAVYVVVRDNLHDQIDDSLSHRPLDQQGLAHDPSAVSRHVPLVQDVFMQVVDGDGKVVTTFDDRPLPVTVDVLAVARGEQEEVFFDAEVDGTSVRVYATSAGQGTALQVGRSLAEVEQALRRLVWALIVISVAAVGLAAVIGRLVAAAAVAPVRRVAEAAETVAQTGELSHHIAVPGGDDLGRLADSFNTMLDALSESLAQQRQLVADASHELRTPLATVRTNVEVLARANELAPDDRAGLIGDTVTQIGELTRLIGDLVELARGDGQEEPLTVIDLDDLTHRVVGVVGRNHPSIAFRVDGVPSLVRGAPGRVSRAVSNLVDNAAKWSPPGAEVEITVADGRVTVKDHGPGLDPADLPHVFDRFYRSPEARTMPGSGLGLAIVKQVAESHGGTVTATAAPGGGALFVLQLTTVRGSVVTEAQARTGFSSTS
ncbi:MAG: HAMP domain-containing histidine kinase [Actinomycetota bacterium]|nr:HAMP domain-containing histidine kinase [Actinomycetota bacterium]